MLENFEWEKWSSEKPRLLRGDRVPGFRRAAVRTGLRANRAVVHHRVIGFAANARDSAAARIAGVLRADTRRAIHPFVADLRDREFLMSFRLALCAYHRGP